MDPYQYINSLDMFGTEAGFKPGLERVQALLAPFGNPERELAVIHAAGSNGKGSTLAFLEGIYREAAYRVGLYTSPHLLHFNERMKINGVSITHSDLEGLVRELAPVVEEVSRSSVGRPTYFEVVTAVAFLYFYRQGVDLLLLEAGLGGRLDATNIVPAPLASLITGISLEHTRQLGDTIEEIAREKAGIIKEGRPVLTGARDRRALDVIRKRAAERGCRLKVVDELYSYKLRETSIHGQVFTASPIARGKNGESGAFEGDLTYFTSLVGEHQVRNALLALATVEELQGLYPVREEAVRAGLRDAYIPGRLELIQEEPLLFLDGAHNKEGIEVLTGYLQLIDRQRREEGKRGRLRIIIGILRDKDAAGMVSLFNFSPEVEMIITRNSSQRSLEPEELARAARKEGLRCRITPDLEAAIRESLVEAGKDDLCCITGSLYTVAEAKILLERYLQ